MKRLPPLFAFAAPALFSGFFSACGGEPAPAAVAPTAPSAVASQSPAPTAAGTTSAAPAAPVQLTDDTPEATPGGATFTAPARWTSQMDGARALLTGPEPDLRVAVVDASASSIDDAVASAWTAFVPDFKRAPKLVQPRPGRRGWDEAKVYTYETSPNEKLVVYALALRKGTSWTIVLVHGALATFEKRASQIGLVQQSLRPKGYTKESFAGKQAHDLDAARVKQITDMIEKAQAAADVPGVAISLVQGGKVVFEGGFGVREKGKPAKADADSLYMIASNTKALTTLLLAKLVDEGKLAWDQPVKSVYPDFKLGDADTTSKVLVKHLVCACTGLPRQDFEMIFASKDVTPKSRLTLLGTMQPTTKFGETFQYSNIMASAAGYVAGAVAYPKKELGAAYDEAMQTRVFGPLGMTGATFDFGRALKANHASAHGDDIDGKTQLTDTGINRLVIADRPAGGAWASVRDVTKYVQMELANGKLPGGKAYVSEKNLLARREAQVKLGETASYGMGLMVDTDYGVTVVHHGGDLVGFHSDMFWLPEHGVGGVILTNTDTGVLLRRPFLRKVLEVLFDGSPEADEDVLEAIKRHKVEASKDRERLVLPPDADAAAKLAPKYVNAALGTIVVRSEGNKRVFDIGLMKTEVASRKNDDGTTSFITALPGVVGLEFVAAERDGKRALLLRDAQHEYVFSESK